MEKKFFPIVENLGRDCMYWCIGGLATGCCYPKAELTGRRSCEGTVDTICLYVREGTVPPNADTHVLMKIKLSPPDPSSLPPGQTHI